MRMHKKAPTPGALDKPLDDFVGSHVAPSESRVSPLHREITTCYAYMCPYAYGCTEKTRRPAQVLMRRCMRYKPEELRIRPGVSDHVLDLLAKKRSSGEDLSAKTAAILDDLRPDGPLRKTA